MSDQARNDEGVLIDFLLGRCEPDAAEQVRRRLGRDQPFRRLHDNLANTFQALGLAPEPEAAEDLLERTLARIESGRRTEALIAKEELVRPAAAPTFSLRELAAAAAAVLILAVLFLPSLRQARTRARINECFSQVGRIGTALLTYANANDGYLPAVEGGARQWLAGADGRAVSNSAALYRLVHEHYVESPVVFQCPAIGGGSFEAKASMTDFPAAKYIGYSYQHMVGSRRLRLGDEEVPETMPILSDENPIFAGGKFHRDRIQARTSDNHGGAGQNVLYLGTQVAWAQSPTVGVNGDNIYLAKGIYEYLGNEAPAEPTDTFLLPSYSAGESPRR